MLSHTIPLCDALVLLMQPLVEIVIHDRISNMICYINGNLSNRKIGDASLLENEIEADLNRVIYPKLNFDGRLIKSISVPMASQWMICINCDISVFNQMKSLSEAMLANQHPKPDSLFKNDWQDKLHTAIHSFLTEKNWRFEALNGMQKKAVLKHLFDLGVFTQKNAANYVAQVLKIGRATVFNNLKQWRSL